MNIREIKEMVRVGKKLSNEEYRVACGSLYLAGIGSDIGIEEHSSALNAKLLSDLANGREQLDILKEFLP